jgi:predicted acyl esterase
MRRFVMAASIVATLLLAAPAAHAQVEAFDGVECQPNGGVRFCQGSVDTRVPSFDGIPLDVNVTLPAAPAAGDGGDYPLIVQLHGYGGRKLAPDSESVGPSARSLAEDGYAVLSYSARGFGQSCGSPASRISALGDCARGWIHLADSRFEARDTQHLAGLLADRDLVAPRKVGVVGVSYGGGQAVQLATLRDRIRLRNGSYRPWLSPDGKRMEIAAAVPIIPWTDLAYSLAPNGRTLDYLLTGPRDDLEPVGILKNSFVAGLYASGQASGYYAPPGADEDSDLNTWFARVNAGEPYNEPVAQGIVDELAENHSGYYLDMDRPPAPILISNGFTDDLFPVDEAVRYENRVRSLHPDATISQLHFDYGHQRGQNKQADMERLRTRTRDWFDQYVSGAGSEALEGVEVFTQTCREEVGDPVPPSEGPFTAPTWRELHPGEVRLQDDASRTIVSDAVDQRGQQVDPILRGGVCVETPSDDQAGTATYRLPPVEDAYTLAGSPTVIADLGITAANPRDTQIAARLWDVAPDGQQTLVARGLYRPNSSGRRVFQLHPNAYRFEAGHVPKLELLGYDTPYARKSNPPPFTISVANMDLRLPTLEDPGSGQVGEPADLFVPEGRELAPGYEQGGQEPGPPDEPLRCKGEDATLVAPSDGSTVRGTNGPDVIVGTDGDDTIRGRGGDDLVCARGGDDDVRGGAGDDRILAQAGDDRVRGGPGRDRILGTGGSDRLVGGAGRDSIGGGTGDDRIDGGGGADSLRGGAGDDRLKGEAGDDFLAGQNGHDVLRGGTGDDTLRGGRGRDTLRGGQGDDRVSGGRGRDDVRD